MSKKTPLVDAGAPYELDRQALVGGDIVDPAALGGSVIRKKTFTAPADATSTALLNACPIGEANSATAVHAAVTLSDVRQLIHTAITNPDVPRKLTFKCNATGMLGVILVVGTAENDATKTEEIVLDGTTNALPTQHTYKTFVSADMPEETHAGTDTISVGTGDQIVTALGGLLNPDVPRCLSITGGASGMTGNVTVTGSIHDDINNVDVGVSEVLALSGTATVNGTVGFRGAVTAKMPVETHADTDTVSIGVTNALALEATLERDTVDKVYLNDVKEAVAPTVVASSTDVSLNTVTLDSVLDGTDVVVYYHN